MFYSIGYVEPDTSLMLAAGPGIELIRGLQVRSWMMRQQDQLKMRIRIIIVINYHQLQKGGKSHKIRRNLSDRRLITYTQIRAS